MVLKRKIYNKLIKWKQSSQGTSALLIEGARRIGKSYIAEKFAQQEYDNYILIDFSRAPEQVKRWFDDYLEDIDMLLMNLQLHYNRRLKPRRSLLIFDEVQDCPRARASIKHLVADGRFDYLETGSLISIKKNVKDILIPSEEETIEMHPMDFEEFLWAMGEDMLADHIRKCFEDHKPMEHFHRRALDLFRQYLIIGGMPQAIAKYVETKDFVLVDNVKRQIIRLYRNDINKYADRVEVRATAIFDALPGQLQQHDKTFRLNALGKQQRMRTLGDAFLWLADANVVNCCYNTTAPNIGLRLNEQRSTLKCYMNDTGLLLSHAFDSQAIARQDLYRKLMHNKLEINEGMLIENVVAQMLKSAGHQLFFFHQVDNQHAENRMEIDFLIYKPSVTSRHNISPIEVKSSTRYRLTSLNKCISKYGSFLATPYVVHSSDYKEEDGITYIPIYMTELL